MKTFLLALFTASLATVLFAAPANTRPAEPVKLIFDTDMGNDVDDALALALIHSLERRGACELLAVTLTNPDPLAGAYVDALNTFYGRGDIPIGVSPHSPQVVNSKFLVTAREKDANGALVFPHAFDASRAPTSVALLRRTLANAADGSVVIAQVGFFTNLAALLDSGPDEHSPLRGDKLVAKKVRLLSLMAGAFQTFNFSNNYREFNVRYDVPAAVKVANEWPTPIIWSGVEVGQAVLFPATAVDHDFSWAKRHPVPEAYQRYEPTPHERPTWDLTSVIYAVYPERGLVTLSPPGRVKVEADGVTRFAPAKNGGRDRFMIVDATQASGLRHLFAALCTEPVTTR